ncbi:hypothetical protein [Burkholderia stabilis]|uniref:hypothetical protein n=1 Tax=Burkholderia stabilis TaxID=95485 RepID=UPI0015886070|nr:hypothetical protein [Burkholderia stabilis]
MTFWPQSLVDWAQIASAIGTCGAVIVSLMLANRGIQTKLEASCEVKRTVGAPKLKVTIRNVGRDSVYLASIGGASDSGAEKFERLLNEEGHLTLAPGEPNTVALERFLTVVTPDGGIPQPWTRMWLKDINGKRFYISNSAECLAEVWGEMDEANQRGGPRTSLPQ